MAAYPFIPPSGSFVAAPTGYHQQQQQQAYSSQAAAYGSYPAYNYGNPLGTTAGYGMQTAGSFTYGGGDLGGPPRTNSFTYNTPAQGVPGAASFAYGDPYQGAATGYGLPTPGLFGYGAGGYGGGGGSFVGGGGGGSFVGGTYQQPFLPGAGSFVAGTPQFQFYPEPSSGSGTAPEGGKSSSASTNTGTGVIPSGSGSGAIPSSGGSAELPGRPRPDSARPPLMPQKPGVMDAERARRIPDVTSLREALEGYNSARKVPLTTTKLRKKKTCGCC